MPIDDPCSLKLPNFHAAIPAWQDEEDRLGLVLEAAGTPGEVWEWYRAKQVNDDKLRRVFLDDTKDRNNWSAVSEMLVSDLIAFSKRFGPG